MKRKSIISVRDEIEHVKNYLMIQQMRFKNKFNYESNSSGCGCSRSILCRVYCDENFASEVVLVDIKEGFAEGKAMDLQQTASLNGFDTKNRRNNREITLKTAGSKVAVITSGIPRKPGMTREDSSALMLVL